MDISRTDSHIIQGALARTINLDLKLIASLEKENGDELFFMLDLVIERVALLLKFQTESIEGLQNYLLNPKEVLANLCQKRDNWAAERNAAYLKSYFETQTPL